MDSDGGRAALSRSLRRCVRKSRVAQKRIALEVGVHESTVSRWLSDQHPSLPDAWQLGVISKLCGLEQIEMMVPVVFDMDPALARLHELVQRMDQRQKEQLAGFLQAVLDRQRY